MTTYWIRNVGYFHIQNSHGNSLIMFGVETRFFFNSKTFLVRHKKSARNNKKNDFHFIYLFCASITAKMIINRKKTITIACNNESTGKLS